MVGKCEHFYEIYITSKPKKGKVVLHIVPSNINLLPLYLTNKSSNPKSHLAHGAELLSCSGFQIFSQRQRWYTLKRLLSWTVRGRQLPKIAILWWITTLIWFIVEFYLLGDFMKKMWKGPKGPVFHLICQTPK